MPLSRKCASSQLYALIRTTSLEMVMQQMLLLKLHHQLNQHLFKLISNIRIGIVNVMVSTLTWICFFLFNMPSKATQNQDVYGRRISTQHLLSLDLSIPRLHSDYIVVVLRGK